jgi:hypothetical protein
MHTAAIEVVRAASASAHGVAKASTWEAIAAISFIFVPVLIGLVLSVAARPRPAGPGTDEDADPGSGGGGGPRLPGGPSQPGGDPTWWPEFERQFADYVLGCQSAVG